MPFFKHLVEDKGARFSPTRVYRYHLWRTWNTKLSRLVVIGLNPSKANEREDDPTIRRCLGFARAWKCGGLDMLNLFAFCATRPRDMMAAAEPIGEENDETILRVCEQKNTGQILAAWGVQGCYQSRDIAVASLLLGFELSCLQITGGSFCQHPLFLKGNIQPQPYLKYRTSTLAWIRRKHTSKCGYRLRAQSERDYVNCEHGYKACPTCTPCTCGIGEDRGF